MSRGEAKRLAIDAGADVVCGVSHKLDYLVAGDDPGSKLQKARAFSASGDLRILDEQEFLRLLQ